MSLMNRQSISRRGPLPLLRGRRFHTRPQEDGFRLGRRLRRRAGLVKP